MQLKFLVGGASVSSVPILQALLGTYHESVEFSGNPKEMVIEISGTRSKEFVIKMCDVYTKVLELLDSGATVQFCVPILPVFGMRYTDFETQYKETVTYRISSSDGIAHMGTRDYNPKRLNLVLIKERIVAIQLG